MVCVMIQMMIILGVVIALVLIVGGGKWSNFTIVYAGCVRDRNLRYMHYIYMRIISWRDNSWSCNIIDLAIINKVYSAAELLL